MKRSRAGILWALMVGLSLSLATRAEAQSLPTATGPRPPRAEAARKDQDGVVRASQDVPPPPVPGSTTMDSAPQSPSPRSSPIEPFALDPGLPRPVGDASAPVSLHYDDRDIRQVLEIFSRTEKMNLLVSPNVSGPITVNLDGVTRQQALEAILSLGNLEVRRTNGLTYIYTAEEFKAFTLGRRKLATRVYHLNYIRANEIALMVKPFLSPDGKVTATPESEEGIDENANFASGLPGVSSTPGGAGGGAAGGGGRGSTGGNSRSGDDVVVVQDYPENLLVVDEMISKLDLMPVQVLIEAIIVRVQLSRTQQLGVNYGAVDQMRTALGVVGNSTAFGSTVGFSPLKILNTNGTLQTGTQFLNGDTSGGIKFGFIGGNVSTFVQALETLGKTNVLATPRVLVLNKQRAEIQLGDRLGYRTLVTNLTSTVQQIQFLNTGTLLRLRPFISDDGMIRMEIHPERSTGSIDANGVPSTNTARMTTNVLVPNGATLVIGGLIENQDDVNQSGVPGLNRLPLVGALFRNRAQDIIKSEVVILLTPRIWNPADPEGLNCAPTTKTSLDTAARVTQKIELGADRPFKDGLLGGRLYYDTPGRADRLQANDPGKNPYTHTVRSGENFWTISRLYYHSGRYYLALWDANKKTVLAADRLAVGDRIIIPRADQLDPSLIQDPSPASVSLPVAPIPEPVIVIPPPPQGLPGPFGQKGIKDPSARVASQSRPPSADHKPAAGKGGTPITTPSGE